MTIIMGIILLDVFKNFSELNTGLISAMTQALFERARAFL